MTRLGLIDAVKVFINCDVENAVIHLRKEKERERKTKGAAAAYL